MNLQDILKRDMNPKPWAEGERMPWDDAAFSERVLKMHLAQDNDAASRPESEIKKHVSWIHRHLLKKQPASILDLGCGPGLYTAMLAKLGHTCTGIDFAPASIEYALKNAPAGCTYRLGDIRKEDFGGDYDLVIFIFGALNLMQRKDARHLLAKIYRALKPGGILLLEVSSFEAVDEIGNQPAMWYSAESGLFSDKPHICLMETFWDEKQNAATERFYILDTNSGEVTRHAATTQAYGVDEIDHLLDECKFDELEYYPSLTGRDEDEQFDLLVVSARKPG